MKRTAAIEAKLQKDESQMHAIRNMVDICGAKVHKLATRYGASKFAGGKPPLSSANG